MTQQRNQQIPNWALTAIHEAREKKLPKLFLSGSGKDKKLRLIPHELFELHWLEFVDLRGNELTDVPEEISQLSNLQMLYLGHNKLVTLPETLPKLLQLNVLDLSFNQLPFVPEIVGQISNLKALHLSDNHLTLIPEAIARLSNLQVLDISFNRLTAVPEIFGRFSILEELYISENLLISVPEVIAKLSKLQKLDLRNNWLTSIPHWLVELPKLNWLYLDDNPITMPPLEVLKLQRGKLVDLSALRAYFRQKEEKGEGTIHEAKLLVVGEPGAGKTSLTRRLIDPSVPLPSKNESTEGIDVHTWNFPMQGGEKDDLQTDFQINVWDFGGQEIYHATHQFFLSRRSLYIVVADAREQKTDFFYWLDLIEHLSDRSPVFIFNNAFQNRHWAINEQQLQAQFPETFQKPFAFNLATDDVGLAYLRLKIQEQITKLPHVGDVLPRTWVNVRQALEDDSRATVTQQEFIQLCRDNDIIRIDDALQLSSYLHDLGVILHFQDDPMLKRTVILRPEWSTDAVYQLLDNEQVKDSWGFFRRVDLHDIWHEDEFTFLHDELLALMMKFQLCYAIPTQKDRYIAPQLLSEQPPDYALTTIGLNERSLYLRYKYEAFMPKGLLTRFIVTMHPYIATDGDTQLVWRTGVVLEKDEARAEVVEFYHRREIRIRVMGKNMRDLLTIISYQLDELHRPFHRLKFDKLIPCNCSICRNADVPDFYRLDVLKTRLEHGKTVIECDVPPFETVSIRPLLDDVGAAVQTAELPALLRTLNREFNDDEFRTLCLELGVNYDNLPGEGLEGKQRELLLMLERNGRLPELINLLRQKRPNFNW